MAMVQHIDRNQVIAMLTQAASSCGMSLRTLYDLGRADALDNPNLRDLWLIWGDVLSEEDLKDL